VTSGQRYSLAGGKFDRLPFTGQEASWISELFGNEGVGVDVLQSAAATESNVSAYIGGRRIVHLACHGVVDQKHGNLFGALALAPGDSSDPADDGFLTLSEIYGLDLAGCELAILSACSTNAGPEQQGEGVWALSRGFLVGGARRTVASNWPVDDEASASLISYYCGGLAKAEKEQGTDAVDYAAALHSARRWVRSQEKWQSPFYWSSFVLVGPN
jgi:CHAT domain-containing protein